MNEDLRDRIALFRYGVISPMVSRTLAPGERERLLSEISEREWEIPGTRRRRIGRSTARTWAGQYERHGFEGLKPIPRKDNGQCRGLSDEIQDLLLRLRQEHPGAPVTRLMDLVREAGPPGTPRLSRTTVYRFFARQEPGSTSAAGSERRPDARAFTHEHINDLWMGDVMHGPKLCSPGRPRGERTYLIALIDDASRLVPHAAFYPSETAACLIDALRHGFLRRGLPRRFYCDNGSAYRTRHLELVCATLNVVLIHSRPRQPRGRGKIERFYAEIPIMQSSRRAPTANSASSDS